MDQCAVSATVQTECSCGLEVKPEIWLCPQCHTYRKGTQTFTSVSRVIKALLPADYSKVPPVVLEIARLRGTFVDSYFCEWVMDPSSVIDLHTMRAMIEPEFPRDGEKHAADTVNRIEILLEWWEGFRDTNAERCVATQGIVYSETDGVAGMFDLKTEDYKLDIKCVSTLQPNYALQLGAYSEYDCAMTGENGDVGIVHVTKDKVRLVQYDDAKCRKQWRACCDWFKTLAELK